jgi:drug/metabolite transporter (DMT)-like permease
MAAHAPADVETDATRQRLADARAARGLWLGVLAMALFGATLPMTRLAIGSHDAPQLSPWFVTFGRAVIAALLSGAFLLATRSPLPRREHWPDLSLATLGNAIGYPLLLAFALRSVSAGHAAVVTAMLPLTTAVVAALMLRQRASTGFWICAIVATALVVLFAMLRAAQSGQSYVPAGADLWLVGAVLAASIGYVAGARLTPQLGAERVICWVTILMLPLSLPATLLTWPAAPVAASAWAALAYVALFSMWAAFFAWYRALDLGGAVRVSQVQVLQPFFAIAFALPLLGEPIDAMTIVFALAVAATVVLGRRFHRRGE